jgi:hypothetical protein
MRKEKPIIAANRIKLTGEEIPLHHNKTTKATTQAMTPHKRNPSSTYCFSIEMNICSIHCSKTPSAHRSSFILSQVSSFSLKQMKSPID